MAGAVVALLVALVVTWVILGGSSDAESAAAESPVPTSTSDAPPPTSTPTPTSVSADPADWIVSDAGIGPLRVGMPFDDAIALVPRAAACRPDADPAYLSDDHRLWAVRGYANAEELGTVAWDASAGADDRGGPRTAEGIGIGSTAADVRTAYPGAVEVQTNGVFLQAGRMYFGLREDVVISIGVTAHEIPWEYCG